MRNLALILALLCPAATPLHAEAPLSAEEFEAFVQGRTLTYADANGPYGIEHYHKDRKVTWAFLDGTCEPGIWYPKGQDICFDYDFKTEPQCWQFFREDDGLRALFTTDPTSTVLYEVRDADQSLICQGLGV
jgi:hypothetical protein